MSEQTLDLRWSVQVIRRYMSMVITASVVGLLAGVGFAIIKPALFSSSALVVLPASANAPTQAVIASSTGVLAGALHLTDRPMSVQDLRSVVQVKSLTPDVLSVSVTAKSGAQAESLANAVAKSYINYTSSNSQPGAVQPRFLQQATEATQASRLAHWLVAMVVGSIAGALVGGVAAIAMGRGDKRLRVRSEIANALGLPVLASFAVWHPSDAPQWARLLGSYQPPAVEAWQLRSVLDRLGLAAQPRSGSAGARSSLTILSIGSDRRALALGPQIAVTAASQGISTALVIGPQQDTNATATLRAACTGGGRSALPGRPLLVVADTGMHDRPDVALTVVVAVVDDKTPRLRGMLRTRVTVLGVSAGTATAEQLARVAASAGADNRRISGILLADPEPSDQTTGRVPHLVQTARGGLPTRVTRAPTWIRR